MGNSKGRRARAKQWILEHPHTTKLEQARALGVSESTVAIARRELIADGLLEPERKNRAPSYEPHSRPATAPAAAPAPAALLDDSAMRAIAAGDSDLDDLGDEESQARLLRQCLRFALDERLHPDTRMSATQVWHKLKEKQREQRLGPGAPMTFEAGAKRLADLILPCGPKMLNRAIEIAYPETAEAPSGAEATTDEAAAAGGTEEAPVEARHEGDPAPAADLRPEHVGEVGGAPEQPAPGAGDNDLPGPEA